jgi:hypothetical protein
MTRRSPRLGAVASLAAGLAACASPTVEFDSQPIFVRRELSAATELGAPAVLVAQVVLTTIGGNSGAASVGLPHPVVVDTAAPVTLLPLGADSTARALVDGRLVRADRPSVTRLILGGISVFNGDVLAADPATQRVGLGTTTEVRGVLGVDVLGRFAVRFEYGDPSPAITLFPNNPLTDEELENAGQAVFRAAPAGGGLFFVDEGPRGTSRVSIGATRVVLQACVEPGRLDDPDGCPGTDMTFVVGTGFGPVVLTDEAVQRLRGAAPASHDGTLAQLGLTVPASPMALSELVIVDDRDPALGPCGELAVRRGLLKEGLTGVNDAVACGQSECSGNDCVNRKNNSVLAATIRVAGETTAAAVSETRAPLEGLRAEIRPRFPEIDGILGGAFLRRFVFEFDYPNQRWIALRCSDPSDASCSVGPTGTSSDLRVP